jgi:hypothetical protein
MSIAYVASVSAAGTATSSAINTTGATLLVASVSGYSGDALAISDSYSNTWTKLTTTTYSGQSEESLFYVANPTVGAGHTFQIANSGTYSYHALSVIAFSGVTATSPYDSTAGQGSGTGSAFPVAVGSITPTNNGSVVIVGMGFEGGISGVSVDGGFTVPTQTPGSSSYSSAIAYLIQTTAAAAGPNITGSGESGNLACAASSAAFIAASGSTQHGQFLPILSVFA